MVPMNPARWSERERRINLLRPSSGRFFFRPVPALSKEARESLKSESHSFRPTVLLLRAPLQALLMKMCSATFFITTIILVPVLLYSCSYAAVWWVFSSLSVQGMKNKAVINIQSNVRFTAVKAEEARSLLKDLKEYESPEQCQAETGLSSRLDLDPDRTKMRNAFDRSVSAAIDTATETIGDAIIQLFSSNFFSVLELFCDCEFLQSLQAVGSEIFELIKIKSER
eukprot:891454-Rhodomonas_salina.5